MLTSEASDKSLCDCVMNASMLLFQAGQRSSGSQVLPSSSEAAGEAILKGSFIIITEKVLFHNVS